ncbi:MAG: hypothetical protein IT176_13925 [Acidobacteria bacterium]|nr:hypothetical protein [Acidobacteriota bacterium]
MSMRRALFPLFAGAGLLLHAAAAVFSAQLSAPFSAASRHPAIDYWRRPPHDPVADLDRKVRAGDVALKYEGETGYLRSVLDALGVPVESQLLVLSKTSFQARLISPANPRALYYNDQVAVGWVRGGDLIEFASQDPEQGTIFYTLVDNPDRPPKFVRNAACLSCHIATTTLEVPGLFAGSVHPGEDGMPLYAPVYEVDHRTPLELRWGGWYVTGRHGAARHMGNAVVADDADFTTLVQDGNQNVASLVGRVDLAGYLSPHSDIVALMVLEHQMRMVNLFTRMGWEARIATPEAKALAANAVLAPLPDDEGLIAATRTRTEDLAALTSRPVDEMAREVVDYMLFVDEAKLSGRIEGTSRFADVFQAGGPRDRKGRSLRQLDLATRLMRYPCSYMIYTPSFDRLPEAARDAVYRRLWEVLSGSESSAIYAQKLPLADRQAIVEILKDTKPGLPDYFTAVTR